MAASNGTDAGAPLIVVSCDTHAGPRLKEDLRPYCPEKYLEQFDDFVGYIEGTNTIRQAGRQDEIRTLLRAGPSRAPAHAGAVRRTTTTPCGSRSGRRARTWR